MVHQKTDFHPVLIREVNKAPQEFAFLQSESDALLLPDQRLEFKIPEGNGVALLFTVLIIRLAVFADDDAAVQYLKGGYRVQEGLGQFFLRRLSHHGELHGDHQNSDQ